MPTEQLKKVLCINDNEVTLFIQKQVLNKSRFSKEVVTTSNGKNGLEYCKKLINENAGSMETYPGLILLDLHMPVMDGWEFLYHFSAEVWPYFKNTKVIITSYSIDEVDSERAKQYPFIIDFLNTSLSTAYLKNLPRSVLSCELV